jgi:hypothetical protein
MNHLPPVLQEVIALDRRLAAERGGTVHTFELHHRKRRITAELRGAWRTDQGDDNTRPPAAAAAKAA